jgi:hypothetical protein
MECLFCCGDECIEEIKQKFMELCLECRVPLHDTVQHLIDKFRETGSLADAPTFNRPGVLTGHF